MDVRVHVITSITVNKSHAGQDIKLHVLLCESHCKNTENLHLLDRYKIHIRERLCLIWIRLAGVL